jgi:DnaK suppressor protein
LTKDTKLPAGYQPTEEEPFMNENQLLYFKHKLSTWREMLLKETSHTLHQLQDTSTSEPDLIDTASNEFDHAIELRARDRDRKLLNKIEEAIKRINDGSYGYCEETGEPISLKRLEARPVATLCIEAQERHERRERTHKDN